VSTIPRGDRELRTRSGVLVQVPIDIAAEPLWCDGRRTPEGRYRRLGRHELSLERLKLANRDAITCDYEGLASIEGAHDLAALVPQLSLSDLACHLERV